MSAYAVYAVAGLALLLATVLPGLVRSVAISSPIVLVAAGMLVGLLPIPPWLDLDPEDSRSVILHVTELTVIISLTGVGLALERSLRPRSWRSWREWSAVWRLLGIAMPLGVVGVALLGHWVAGLAPAVAILLGAALAPTDPVLASDVQVGQPVTGEIADDADLGDDLDRDEIRFTLTAEAGLNDGLAFPFLHLGLLLAAGSASGAMALEWLGFYVLVKIAVGAVVGVVTGLVMARLAFRSRPSLRLAEQGEPLLALAGLLTAYGVAELAQGYGFLSVFACAMALRAMERRSHYHREMHSMIERLERLLTLTVLLLLGMATTHGLLEHLDWQGVAIGLGLLLVVRPLTALAALRIAPRPADRVGGLAFREQLAVSYFGVRGVGSLFYMAYAATHLDLPRESWLWSVVAFTVVASVLLHGITATPVMRRLEGAED